jgi:hypothetical protein
MNQYSLTRATILAALHQAFEPLPYVYAMWEGGAAAFNRVDQWSDIDLQVDVADEHVDEVMALAERNLAALSPIHIQYVLPQPTWHGHAQTFFWLEDAGPFLLVDFVAMKHSNTNKFLEHEVHGSAVVHFDKTGVLDVPPIDAVEFTAGMRRRLETLRVTFPLFQSLVAKEVQRGNAIEALAFYQGFSLRPLVEVVRMLHSPYHYNFHTRYVYYELPPEIVRRLEALFFVKDLEDVVAKQQIAQAWFAETLAELDREKL